MSTATKRKPARLSPLSPLSEALDARRAFCSACTSRGIWVDNRKGEIKAGKKVRAVANWPGITHLLMVGAALLCLPCIALAKAGRA